MIGQLFSYDYSKELSPGRSGGIRFKTPDAPILVHVTDLILQADKLTQYDLYEDPTETGYGTLLETRVTMQSGIPEISEWLLKPNEDYLFKATNRSKSSGQVNMCLVWEEITED